MEYAHHGDPLVPRQQRFSQYTRSLMKGLGVPVQNQYGLRPAIVQGTRKIAPLTIARISTSAAARRTSRTFNFHPHLPHYAVTTKDTKSIHVLAQQPIDLDRPHPFTEAGNRSSTAFSGCRRRTNERATSCWPTRRSSRRCLAARTAWRISGKISP